MSPENLSGKDNLLIDIVFATKLRALKEQTDQDLRFSFQLAFSTRPYLQIRHFFNQKSIDIFLFLHNKKIKKIKKIKTNKQKAYCGYSSNEYPHHILLWRNKKVFSGYHLLSGVKHITTLSNGPDKELPITKTCLQV